MLPGFRFLFAAIVLCVSILMFGLGAAALLRAAHEEVAQNPSWRGAPEPRFAQSEETQKPVLAMLRVEPPAAEPKTDVKTEATAEPKVEPKAESTATVDVPATPPQPGIAPVEAGAITSPAMDEKAAAPPSQEPSQPVETAKAEAPSSLLTSTPAELTAAPTAAEADIPAAANTKIAAVGQGSPAASEKPAIAEPVVTPTAPAPDQAPGAASIATLAGSTAATEPDANAKKQAVAEDDREEAKKRLRAERARERRREAARRARVAKQQAAVEPAVGDPFGRQLLQAQLTQQSQSTLSKRKTR
jgi:hypothetical protein